ncbi:hypothetical protein [Streptomyces wuyuanensis]|uniref:hypothetical protein n=1 Tax=Streptomyces wuyuanensis TaxID=1196353 RepID=UPI0037B7028E
MTPKLRTHCATTLAALVLALPVATYAHTDGPPALAEASRGDGEGGRSSGEHGGDGRAGIQGRDESGRGGSDRNDGDARNGDRERSRGRSWDGQGGNGQGGNGQRGDGQGGAAGRWARGGPAQDAPSAPRTTVRTAPETAPGAEDDRQQASAGRTVKPRTPPVEQAAERPDPSPTASLAGRQAGEGRLRPGRTTAPSPTVSTSPDRPHDGHDDPDHDPDHDHDHARERDENATPHDEAEDESRDASDAPSSPVAPTPADDASPAAAGESHPHPVSQPLERQVPVLTLGAGCALMGLGLGYMGLRLRRG